MTRRRDGFALMAAMWLVVIIGLAAWQLSLASRARRLAAANALELTTAGAAADAGLATAQAALGDSSNTWSRRAASRSTSEPDPWAALAWPARDTIVLGEERVLVSVEDPGARIHLNRASVDELRRFLSALSLDADAADRLAQRIADWRDADDLPRARGAERAEYLRNGARLLPANRDFGTVEELRAVDGVTPELFDRMARHLTLFGLGQVNINAAPAPVLYSLPGFGDEAVASVLRLRAERRPLHSLTDLTRELSRSAAGALRDAAPDLEQRVTFDARQVVIDALGWVDGSPVRARRTMLVTRSGASILVEARRVRDE